MATRLIVTVFCAMLANAGSTRQASQRDLLPAAGGPIEFVPLGHASLAIQHRSIVVLTDPARFGPGLPPAPQPTEAEVAQFKNAKPVVPPDGEPAPATLVTAFFVRPGQLSRFSAVSSPTVILVTDIHTDHLDPRALAELATFETTVIVPPIAEKRLLDLVRAEILANGERRTISGVAVEAIPMYNPRPDPESGTVWHRKGRGNGYIISIGGRRIYVAGDTGCTPELKALKDIDVAFLPMNLPYTMSPSEAADCARAFVPKIAYPYHYFGSDPEAFSSELKNTGIDVRLRDWYAARPTVQQ